jgi:hypothetical protein
MNGQSVTFGAAAPQGRLRGGARSVFVGQAHKFVMLLRISLKTATETACLFQIRSRAVWGRFSSQRYAEALGAEEAAKPEASGEARHGEISSGACARNHENGGQVSVGDREPDALVVMLGATALTISPS